MQELELFLTELWTEFKCSKVDTFENVYTKGRYLAAIRAAQLLSKDFDAGKWLAKFKQYEKMAI